MTSDYIITFTDNTKSSFNIKPFSVNGPAKPSPNNPLCNEFVPLYTNDTQSAISANTSLVLLGKGSFDYGEPIQRNIVHLLEHFANNCPPLYPIEGQLWYNNTLQQLNVYNDSTWFPLLRGDGDVMTGFLTLNADPTTALHAATKQYVDALVAGAGVGTFVHISGDVMTGFLTLNADPTTALHAATKQYVDAVTISTTITGDVSGAGTLPGSIVLSLPLVGSSVLNSFVKISTDTKGRVSGTTNVQDTDITSVLGYIPTNLAGDVMTGFLTLNADPTTALHAATKQYVDAATGAGTFVHISGDVMTGFLTLNADPTTALHAATKQYVDALGITSVTFDQSTGVISFARTGNPSVAVTGVASRNLARQPVESYTEEIFPEVGSWILSSYLNQLDVQINRLSKKINRQISTGTVLSAYTLDFFYPVEENKLSVFINGVKQYNNVRGNSIVEVTQTPTSGYQIVDYGGIVIGANATGLSNDATVYSATVIIDGTSHIINVTGSTAQTFTSLISQINADIVGFGVASISGGNIMIISDTTGVNSSVNIGNDALFIFTAGFLFLTSPINGLSSTIYLSYSTGLANDGTTYHFTVTVDGGAPQDISMTGSSTQFFYQMLNNINSALTGAACLYESGKFVIYSNTSGVTSSVTASDTGTLPHLFSSINAAIGGSTTFTNVTGSTYGYTENGNAGTLSNAVTLTTAPVVSDVIEFIGMR